MKENARVLYLTPGCFDKGGVSRYSRYQIRCLRDWLGNDNVRVLSLMGPDEHSLETPLDVWWHGKNTRTIDKVGFALRAILSSLTWRPDVVHLAHVHFSPLCRFLSRICGAKTLLNVYGLEIWSGLSARRRQGMWGMDHVIADCHSTGDYVRSEKLHRDDPSIIWDPVDLDVFYPDSPNPSVVAKYGIPSKEDHFVILTLGRLSQNAAHKGYERLLEVFSALAKEQPKAVLVYAGRGDLREKLEAMAHDMGLSSRVFFTGAIDEKDLADVYRSATVFSLVSDKGVGRGEGIPMTPLEAMACGLPIIVGNEDGSKEAVMDGRNGVVIDPRNLGMHLEAFRKFINDGEYLRNSSEAAVDVAKEFFGLSRFRDELLQVYRSHF